MVSQRGRFRMTQEREDEMKRSILSLLLTVTILAGCGAAAATADDKADTTVSAETSAEETSASVETDEVASNE